MIPPGASLRFAPMMRALAIVVVAVAAACATAGTSNNTGQDAPSNEHFDASPKIYDDAPSVHGDASRPIDAPPAPPPDAPPGSGGQVCSVNMDCPDAGTCCFIAVCVPGTGVGSDLCFPS